MEPNVALMGLARAGMSETTNLNKIADVTEMPTVRGETTGLNTEANMEETPTVIEETTNLNKMADIEEMPMVRVETTGLNKPPGMVVSGEPTDLNKTADDLEMSTVFGEPIDMNKTVDTIGLLKPPKERTHKCDYCGKLFLNAGHLKSHVFIHTGERPYKCDLCDKSYLVVVEPIDLNKTADMVDCPKPLKKRTHKCDYCGKLFLNAGHLKSHVFIHTGERPYKCDLCDKSYLVVVEPIDLNKTADMVDCPKPLKKRTHKCDYCGKLFLNAGHLKSHVFIHTGERPYKCDLCDKSYIDKCRFIVHKRSHSGEKPFPCHFCEKRFAAARLRRTHE